MREFARHQVGNGFNPAMGMGREAPYVVIGVARVKRIQHQEGVKILDGTAPQNPVEADAGAIHSRLALHNTRYFS